MAHYVEVTGDIAVLDEMVPFLEGPGTARRRARCVLRADDGSASRPALFEHCALALDTSLATGAHGLPLMGTGDWNDGMDRVGEGGKGESVWLGWFLYAALTAFAVWRNSVTNRARGSLAQHAAILKNSLEREAWDGDWYRRAYFDDGIAAGLCREQRMPHRFDRAVLGA